MPSNEVIDLTASSPPQQPELNAASITPDDTSAPDKVKRPSSKRKPRNDASGIDNGTSEQSDAPRASVEPHPLAESKEATQPTVPQRAPPSKRKRGHADHVPEPAACPTDAASEDWDRPGPLKRHRSDQGDGFRRTPPLLARVAPALDVSATSETVKAQKKKRNRSGKARRPKAAKKKDSTSGKEEGELTEAEGNNPHTTNESSNTNKENRRRSESPPRPVSKASGKKRKMKSKSASGQKATSDAESVQSSTSHMFFVDTDPTNDVFYENPEVEPKYRAEKGNLLLPHHVLLETAEEQQFSLSAVEVPPTDDTNSDREDDFQLIEDINGVCFTFLNEIHHSGPS